MNLVTQIKNELYPRLYKKVHNLPTKSSYLISRRKWFSRYAVLCVTENDLSNIGKLISDSRNVIKHELNAFLLLGEVGVFLIINTEDNIDNFDLTEVEVDMTAYFKSVILQGVCIISSGSDKPALKLSNWGSDENPILFGDCDRIIHLISEKIESNKALPATNA